MAIALTAVNLWFRTHGLEGTLREVTTTQRLLGASGVIWFYVDKLFLPFHLSFVYPQWQIDPGNFRCGCLAGGAATTAGLIAKRGVPWVRATLFAWMFFCIALLPVMGFADVYFMKYSLVAGSLSVRRDAGLGRARRRGRERGVVADQPAACRFLEIRASVLEIRLEPQRLAKLIGGRLDAAHLGEGRAQIVVILGRVGPASDRRVVFGDSILEPAMSWNTLPRA